MLHPLTPEQPRRHEIAIHVDGRQVSSRSVPLPLAPPLSYLADPFVPLLPPRVDAWFGFNPLACARGLAARGTGRARRVFLWSVDFVPERFGPGTPATRLYDRLDRLCCTRADARIELTEAARDARARRHGHGADAAPAHVVPMGAWLDRVPTTTPEAIERRRVVFLGHLVPRQGVDILLEALALLHGRGDEIAADVIGGGPLEEELRGRAAALGLGGRVTFHGFVPDHRDVERLLAGASVAAAPYRPDETFTAYADPGKLKAYVAAGLPTVLTDVPPNAAELAAEAGAELVRYDATSLAEALERILAAPEDWQRRRTEALAYARRFDWPVLLADGLRKLGLEPRGGGPAAAR